MCASPALDAASSAKVSFGVRQYGLIFPTPHTHTRTSHFSPAGDKEALTSARNVSDSARYWGLFSLGPAERIDGD